MMRCTTPSHETSLHMTGCPRHTNVYKRKTVGKPAPEKRLFSLHAGNFVLIRLKVLLFLFSQGFTQANVPDVLTTQIYT